MGGLRGGMGFPRGAFPGRVVFPGGGRRRGGGIGIVGLLVFLVLAFVFGVDPRMLLQDGSVQAPVEERAVTSSTGDEDLRDFVAVVLADTEDTWHALFRAMGSAYQEPKLVLFSGATQSGCGFAGAAVGPFYCGLDRRVYLDLGFFEELSSRFGAPGDFARAYVIAHEVGHHVQNLMGILDQVNTARSRLREAEANALSVRLELQADCFAGLWAHHAERQRQILEAGDIEEALGAASAVGDDRLQQQAQGRVAPDSFTHGSAAQRVNWFRRGFESGEVAACDSFAAERV